MCRKHLTLKYTFWTHNASRQVACSQHRRISAPRANPTLAHQLRVGRRPNAVRHGGRRRIAELTIHTCRNGKHNKYYAKCTNHILQRKPVILPTHNVNDVKYGTGKHSTLYNNTRALITHLVRSHAVRLRLRVPETTTWHHTQK